MESQPQNPEYADYKMLQSQVTDLPLALGEREKRERERERERHTERQRERDRERETERETERDAHKNADPLVESSHCIIIETQSHQINKL